MNGSSKKEKHDKAVDLLYILPILAIFLLFILYPIIQVFYISFFEREINGDIIFIGPQNFAGLFANPNTSRMFRNTFLWVFIGVAFRLPLGLFMALVLYRKSLSKKMMISIILAPYVMPAAVPYMIQRPMYNPMFGRTTQFLTDTHILRLLMDLLGNSKTSLTAIVIVDIRAVMLFYALNILSATYSIPSYIYEATRIDGANGKQQFFSATLPLITSSVRTLGLLIRIRMSNTFDVIYMMTQDGPTNSSSIMTNFIYQDAFQFNNRGYLTAINVVSLLILSIFAALYMSSKGEDTRCE